MNEKNSPKPNIRWHGAFATTMAYELAEYADKLTLETEHQLSKEALRIDVLVIKKEQDIVIEKNIGKIFKAHNIVEYKSPTDYLSVYDYNKVKGYAYLYSAFEAVDPDQLTITFVIPEITPTLRTYLVENKAFAITNTGEGISYIADNSFSIQIIEQKKLSSTTNLFFSLLSDEPATKDIDTLLKEMKIRGKPIKNNPLLDVISKANPKNYKEAIAMQSEATYQEIAQEIGKSVGMVDEATKMREIAKKMLRVGDSLEKIALVTDLDIETITGL